MSVYTAAAATAVTANIHVSKDKHEDEDETSEEMREMGCAPVPGPRCFCLRR